MSEGTKEPKKFKLVWADGTVAHVDKVQALQDGEWKQIAFPEMLYSPDIRVVEDN